MERKKLIDSWFIFSVIILLLVIGYASYKDYIAQNKIKDMHTLIDSHLHSLPAGSKSLKPTKHIAAISKNTDGSVHVELADPSELHEQLNGLKVVYTPYHDDGVTEWSCVYNDKENSTINAYFPNCDSIHD